MNELEISIVQFLFIYIILLVVLLIMKLCGMNKTLEILMASLKMSVQLVIAGLLLEYIFKINHPAFTLSYLAVMVGFTIYRVLSKNKWMNKNFKIITSLTIAIPNLLIIAFFICVVTSQTLWNPQFLIPIGGMLLGNAMTANNLCLKSFHESLDGQRNRINALIACGAPAKTILMPFVKQSWETALLPTMNSMLGMGIVHLPGMMTGSILAGAVPFTAILYQIAIMIAICSSNMLSCFLTLYLGNKTLIDKSKQTINI